MKNQSTIALASLATLSLASFASAEDFGNLTSSEALATPSLQTIATQLIEEFDLDGIAGLSSSEFAKAAATLSATPSEDASSAAEAMPNSQAESDADDAAIRLSAAFAVADADQDGSLNYVELVDALNSLRGSDAK